MKESRLFKIIYYILSRENVTASELAEKMEVSIRTIYRDIDTISSAGIPIYTSVGRNGGIQFQQGYVLNRSILSSQEKQNILLALQNITILSKDQKMDILNKISGIFCEEIPQWLEIDLTLWGANKNNNENEKFSLLEKAIKEKTIIQINYISGQSENTCRKVKPLKLLFKSSAWYLQAFCIYQNDFRVFKLNRIIDVKLTEEMFENIDFPKPSIPITENDIDMELVFSSEIAYRVYDEFDKDCITLLDNGDLYVKVRLPNKKWLVRYLLSFGKTIKVLSPEFVITQIRDEIEILNRIYKT